MSLVILATIGFVSQIWLMIEFRKFLSNALGDDKDCFGQRIKED